MGLGAVAVLKPHKEHPDNHLSYGTNYWGTDKFNFPVIAGTDIIKAIHEMHHILVLMFPIWFLTPCSHPTWMCLGGVCDFCEVCILGDCIWGSWREKVGVLGLPKVKPAYKTLWSVMETKKSIIMKYNFIVQLLSIQLLLSKNWYSEELFCHHLWCFKVNAWLPFNQHTKKLFTTPLNGKKQRNLDTIWHWTPFLSIRKLLPQPTHGAFNWKLSCLQLSVTHRIELVSLRCHHVSQPQALLVLPSTMQHRVQ